MIKHLYYNGVKLIARLAVTFFYNPIEINGRENIPADSGHLIFAPNHQSAFLDAILVAVYSTRPIHFLTRADVFYFPFNLLLSSLNMMPVYRMRDGYNTLSRNEAVFNTCRDLVRAGKPILLFPEASQELVFYLRPLSRGLSRIACLTQDGFSDPVHIIPVGINYFHQWHGGVKLTLNFGKAINVKQVLAGAESEAERYNRIREASSMGMKETLLIPEKTDDYSRQVLFLNRLYYDWPFGKLRQKIASGEAPILPKNNRFMQLLVAVLSLVNLPFHLLCWLVIRLLVKDKTFHASIKVSLIMFLFPIWLIVCLSISLNAFGWPTALSILILQLLCFQLRQKLLKYWY